MRVTLPLFKIFAHYGHENFPILAHKISAPQCDAAQYASIGAPDAQNSLRILAHELFAHFCQKKSCALSAQRLYLGIWRTKISLYWRTNTPGARCPKIGARNAQNIKKRKSRLKK